MKTVVMLAEEYDMLPRGGQVLCAVSGGADSMCLLHLLKSMEASGGFTVLAAHFNHQIRGADADRDAVFVQDWCREHQIPFYLGQGDVCGEARRRGKGLEETARELRYAFLQQTADALHACRIATAHNADDNTETLLLHLTRGCGLQGLVGIPPRRGGIVRPLLTTSRADIIRYLEQHGVPHVEDESNGDESYSRNKIRLKVMPILRSLNPRFSERAGETMARLRSDNDFLNARAAEVCLAARWAEDNLVIEARHIAQQPAAIAPRAVRRLLELIGDGAPRCTAAHLNAVVDLAGGEDPSAVVFLPGGLQAQRVYKELLITSQTNPLPPFLPVKLHLEGETLPEGTAWRFTCVQGACPNPAVSEPGHFYLSKSALQGPLVLRPRQVGDELTLPHRPGAKTVKKLMIDAKLPRRLRERVPVLADGSGVLAVAGFGPEQSRLARPGEPALEIKIEKTDNERGLE